MSATQVSFAEFALASIAPAAATESTPSAESMPGPSLDAGLVAHASVGGGECPEDRWRRRSVLLRHRWERKPYGVLQHTFDGPNFSRYSNRARAWNSARRCGGLFVEL